MSSTSGGGWSSRRSRPVKSERDVVDLGATFGISLGSDSDSSDAEFAPENEEKDSADSEPGSNHHSSGEEGGDEKETDDEEEDEGEGVKQEERASKEGEGEGERKTDAGSEGERETDGGMEKEVESAPTKESGDTREEVVEEMQVHVVQKDFPNLESETADNKTKCTDAPANPKPPSATGSVESNAGSDEGKETGANTYDPLIVRRSNRAIKPTKDVDLYLLGAKFGIDVEGLSGAESSDKEFAPAENSPESLSESSDDGGDVNKKAKKLKGGKEGEEEMEVGVEASTLQLKVPSEDEYSRSVSEFSINQEAVQQLKVDVHVALCAVCLEDSLDGDVVECDRCGISVHEGCYGVPEEEGAGDDKSSLSSFTTIPWFCDTCKAGVNPANCACELCPMRGGLYKQATNGHWVHMVCSLYTPGIEYVEPALLSGVTLDCLSASRWGAKRCQLCEDEFFSKTGVCIGCDAGLCKNFFHATCAQQQGLLCEMDNDEEDPDVADPYFAHCRAHSDKTTSKRKRRDFLAVFKKQKRFKFDESDDRIVHYLGEAKKNYTSFFKKMINYYRPELTAHFEDRLFHFQPSALKRLTRKAQLLGFTVEVDQGVSRRKVIPDLTNEFVNHFNERLSRQKELRESEKRLTASHRDLKEEELKMKHQVFLLEKELNSLRVEGQDLKRQAAALYTYLGRLSGEKVALPEGVTGEEVEGEEEEKADTGVPVCIVCSKREEPHLMALCDTCEEHYHITCLDPPLSRVPKKTSKWGWQCHRCCFESGDDMAPTIANFDEPASRCGRKINAPKVFTFPDDQVKKSAGRPRKKGDK